MVDVEAKYPTVVSKCLLVKLYTNWFATNFSTKMFASQTLH